MKVYVLIIVQNLQLSQYLKVGYAELYVQDNNYVKVVYALCPRHQA